MRDNFIKQNFVPHLTLAIDCLSVAYNSTFTNSTPSYFCL